MKTQLTATYAREEPMRKPKSSFSSLKKCSDAWTDPFAPVDNKKFSEFVLKTLDPIPGTVMGSGKENRVRSPDDQGHTFEAMTGWGGHAIALINGRYFDPSYGAGPFIDPKDYENKIIHALLTKTTTRLRPNGSYVGQNPGVADSKFTTFSLSLNK